MKPRKEGSADKTQDRGDGGYHVKGQTSSDISRFEVLGSNVIVCTIRFLFLIVGNLSVKH